MGARKLKPHTLPAICVPIPLVLLELQNLTVEFPSPQGPVAAVRDISLSLAAGETLALVGESGSGKSVTSLAIMGLLPPQARLSGSVLFEGRELTTARRADLEKLRGARMTASRASSTFWPWRTTWPK